MDPLPPPRHNPSLGDEGEVTPRPGTPHPGIGFDSTREEPTEEVDVANDPDFRPGTYIPVIVVFHLDRTPSLHVSELMTLLRARAAVVHAWHVGQLATLIEQARNNLHGIILADGRLMDPAYVDMWLSIYPLIGARKHAWPFILSGNFVWGALRNPEAFGVMVETIFGVPWAISSTTAERMPVVVRNCFGEQFYHYAGWLTCVPKEDQIAIHDARSPDNPPQTTLLLTSRFTNTSVALHAEQNAETDMPMPIVGWIGLVNDAVEESKYIIRLCQLEYGFMTTPPRFFPDYTVTFEVNPEAVSPEPTDNGSPELEAVASEPADDDSHEPST
ncbi:uncharacterized protein BO97DRAFT_411084 [Aspergillus homomorphus CBS 101889]|uniref:Uncharacterized protein n=1 Tax=Aspergillus homomorphus (strain CBS 101889) TaxID=1450537 RepID=A0A395I699_ASPHC|nr:hypothetical protein BO97DRAFT_411084 [Aspergillus homomorphus CBS 101889]RAL15782.1 hypothetical protein BO97DRAFT_411084 [Aspergillus homomorphus CBS 101889]